MRERGRPWWSTATAVAQAMRSAIDLNRGSISANVTSDIDHPPEPSAIEVNTAVLIDVIDQRHCSKITIHSNPLAVFDDPRPVARP